MHSNFNLVSFGLAVPLLLGLLLQGGSCGRRGGTNSTSSNNGNLNGAMSTNHNAAQANGNADSTNRNRAGETATQTNAGRSVGKGEAVMERSGETGGATNRDGSDAGGGSSSGGGSGGKSVAAGTWGGRGVRLQVSASGADIEYDCAHGTIGKMTLDAAGRFDAQGTHAAERGGPVRADEEAKGQPARYTGRIEGKTMTLRVVLTGTNQTVGTFTLTHGDEGRLVKCL